MPVRGYYFDEKTGFYVYDFRVRGHRFRGSTEKSERREAEKFVKAKRKEAEAVAAQDAGDKPMTFAVASSRWYAEKGGQRARPAEVDRYLEWLQTKIGNSTLIAKIDDNAIARLVLLRQDEEVSSATVNRTVIEPLRAILRRAALWGQKTAKVEWSQHILGEPKERVRELSDVEEEKLLAAIRPDYRAAFEFAILSALRLDELVCMEWEHIDFGGRKLNLVGKGNVISTIPLTTPMEKLLRGQQTFGATGPVWLYNPKRRQSGNVSDMSPRPMTYQGLKTEWRRTRARAGIPSTREDALLGYRWHDNRHTGITRLVRDSGNLKLGQKLARHTSIATTMKYAHATEDDLRKAMETAQTSRESSRDEKQSAEIVKPAKELK